MPSDGENVPLVTVPGRLPAREDRVAGARDAAALDREGGELLGGALGAGGGDRLGAGEPRLLLAAPAEAGLDRVAVRPHVVAVQVEADLEPKRVAGAETAGGHTGGEQLPPELGRVVGSDEDLDPVLAGVAGAADERAGAGDVERRRPHPGREIGRRQAGDGRACLRSLDGDHREVGSEVDDLDVEWLGELTEAGQVRLVVGGVGDGQERHVPALEPVAEEVVEDAAVVGAEARVLGAADGELRDVVADHVLEE